VQDADDFNLVVDSLIKKAQIDHKLESLTAESGVHVLLVFWKAASAVQGYAAKSIANLAMCNSDFAVLEAILHNGLLPVNEIGKKLGLTSGSMTVAVDRLGTKGLLERRAHGTDQMIETAPLEQAADAYARMMQGKARFRMVLVTKNSPKN
jgi:DNA-binding MarR family transcriptional regulator